MKKRVLFILLAALLVLSCAVLLSACKDEQEGGDTPAPSPEEPAPAPQTQSFTVSFTGEGVSINAQTVKEGTTALQPKSPTLEGYDFAGWYTESGALFDFATPVTGNLTLVARWSIKDTDVIAGSGTKEDPYVILNAKQLVSFAARVNDPENDTDPDFYRAVFRLGADIDMTGVAYTPAGKEQVIFEGEENETQIRGFSGSFDGAGYKVKGLKMDRMIRTAAYIGLFGETYQANIKNLTVEYEISVTCFANGTDVRIYVGGVAGYALLTNFENVQTHGRIVTSVMASNFMCIGGIAGVMQTTTVGGQNYIAYAENCFADIEIVLDKSEAGSSLDGALSGGLFGMVYNYNGAVAILNSATSGKVLGGSYTGGLVGQLSGSCTTILNCMSSCRVESTAAEYSYTGGLVGISTGDNMIMDSYTTGRVVGKAATSSAYRSYVGSIIGYAEKDDYESYYTAGTAVLNCYHTGAIGGNADVTSTLSTKIAVSSLNRAWILSTLRWDAESWSFADETGAALSPTSVKASDLRTAPKLTLMSRSTVYRELDRSVGEMYALVGEQTALPNSAPEVFFGWEHAAGVPARFYVPVIKDMQLNAHWQDVSAVAGKYTGTATLHESRDAGVLILREDGTLQWINSGVTTGTYIYDGTHILMEINDSTGEISGTLKDGSLDFLVDAGMSGTVTYEMSLNTELRYIGEYFSTNGDIITFGTAGKLTFQSNAVGDNRYLSATYTESGNVLTLTSTYLSAYFSTMTITVDPETDTLSVQFVAKPGSSYSLEGVTFSRAATPNYTGKGFVNTYYCMTTTYGSYEDHGTQYLYRLILNADGTAIYRSRFSDTAAYYYYFESAGVIKLVLEGNVSTLYYDAEAGILRGAFNRGIGSCRQTVMTPETDGKLYCFMIGGLTETVFVNDTHRYYIVDGEYQRDAVITGTFADLSRVSINGKYYIARHYVSNSSEGYGLLAVGAEEGSYTYGSLTITLDGIGGVTGTKSGSYRVYDGLVVILFADDTLLGFDHAAAKAADGVITEQAHDGYQGIWFRPRNETDTTNMKYYKWVVDGYGHTTLFYYSEEYEAYRYNWSSDTGWGTYTETATGITCVFNSYQEAEVSFYYSGKLAYSERFGYLGKASFVAEGYTGTKEPPALPASAVGSYTGTDAESHTVILNLNSDLTGSYQGNPFVGIYDGENCVVFKIGNVQYSFNIRTCVLSFGTATVNMTAAGAVTDVIPAALAGTWRGQFSGYGTTTNDVRTVTVTTAGAVTYQSVVLTGVRYDGTEMTITGTFTDGEYTWEVTMVYSLEDSTFAFEMQETEQHMTLTATLTKA